MSGEILILVRTIEEAELTRTLVGALPGVPFRLLFGQEELRSRFFGDTPLPTSVDLARFFVEPPTLLLALCFSGGRELGANSNLLWLSFLNEVGVPTVELQRDLLQNTAAAADDSVAREYWTWGGEHGIGAPVSVVGPTANACRDDVIAVSSQLSSGAYTEEERFRFVFALLRLARETPECVFLWRPLPAEINTEASQYWELLEKLAPANLVIEEHESLARLLARCRYAIGMPGTPMLDAVAAGTASLLFAGKQPQPPGAVSGACFRDFTELRAAFGALRREPARFTLSSTLTAWSAETLAPRIARAALADVPDRADALTIGLRYVAYFGEPRMRSDVGKANAALTALDKRIAALEQ
ncbi:MAG TPA: hypothetical protein VFZ61_20875, partial [Polyangiales bacterium]